MRLLTATIVLISAVINIENVEVNDQNNNFLLNIQDRRSNNFKRIKRAFDKSQNTMEMGEDILTGPEKQSAESLEDRKIKLELGQKYNAEFQKLLTMDGIELERAVVDQLNQSLVNMFTDTMKETMTR